VQKAGNESTTYKNAIRQTHPNFLDNDTHNSIAVSVRNLQYKLNFQHTINTQ